MHFTSDGFSTGVQILAVTRVDGPIPTPQPPIPPTTTFSQGTYAPAVGHSFGLTEDELAVAERTGRTPEQFLEDKRKLAVFEFEGAAMKSRS